MKLGRANSRGDTIIEVMLALTLLSAILFTSWAIINRSTQISAAARQRTAMVNQIKEQAEVLKSWYANEATRPKVINRQFDQPTPLPVVANVDMGPVGSRVPTNPCATPRSSGVINPYRGFYFDESGAVQKPVKTSVAIPSNEAVWIQMNQQSGYIDFYIRACWRSGSGSSQKDDNSQIIVRLNI